MAFKHLSPLGCLEVYEPSLNTRHLEMFELHGECRAGIAVNSFFFHVAAVFQLSTMSRQDAAEKEVRDALSCWSQRRIMLWVSHGTANMTSVHSVPGHSLTTFINIGKDSVIINMTLFKVCVKMLMVANCIPLDSRAELIFRNADVSELDIVFGLHFQWKEECSFRG